MHNPLGEVGRQIVLGSMMGDGCLFVCRTSRHARFQTNCAAHYKEYLEWKYSHLEPVCRKGIATYTRPQNGKPYTVHYFCTRSMPMFTQLRSLLYPEGKRIVSGKVLNRLNEVGLATWICDDGYLNLHKNAEGHINGRELVLHTEHYKAGCCDVIRRWFKERFDINVKLRVARFSFYQMRPHIVLNISAYDAYHVIRPYVISVIESIPCMGKKMDFHYKNIEGPSAIRRSHKPSQSAHEVIRVWMQKYPGLVSDYKLTLEAMTC